MSCGPEWWAVDVVETFGDHCCEKSEWFLLPAGFKFTKGTVFVLDEDNTPDGSPYSMVKPMEEPPEDKCTGVFILKCDVDTNNAEGKPCKVQLCIRGSFSIDHMLFPYELDAEGNPVVDEDGMGVRWGMDKIRKVKNAARCCGLHLFTAHCGC